MTADDSAQQAAAFLNPKMKEVLVEHFYTPVFDCVKVLALIEQRDQLLLSVRNLEQMRDLKLAEQ